MYDVAVGRWFTQDPMDQFASPYLYAFNNPINAIDPNGSSSYNFEGEEAKEVFRWLQSMYSDSDEVDEKGKGKKSKSQNRLLDEGAPIPYGDRDLKDKARAPKSETLLTNRTNPPPGPAADAQADPRPTRR